MPISQRLGWIGVDVGTHTVKLAQVARDGADVRLHRAAVIQRPSAWNGADSLALEQPAPSHAGILCWKTSHWQRLLQAGKT